jgi:hypothetical protein
MAQTRQEFQQRMRSDRAFRQRILAARKAGTLYLTLAQEGYEFDLSTLVVHLPQVHTGIRAGQNPCYCMISPPKDSNTE